MNNNYDEGLQQDFDNMTLELGREILVYPYDVSLTYEGQEGASSAVGDPVTEIAFLQELDGSHEVVASGQLDVGDVRIFFMNDSIAEEEGYVYANGNWYKLIKMNIIKGMTGDKIVYVKGYGKKLPLR
jgi:hypothetical protein